ncbi:DUF6702 family protein [Microscilla marina]|uniref:Orphan protein n=1 Tax=Microscilla marina ATCC 23134 TaxID=313606 RepID=A1ZLR7_MICM2|nr:DUF6702 family protein [Microscilla marina]EAY28822.1 hypothetical protein M23134_07920 [Microscilla marina ATCC 23134]
MNILTTLLISISLASHAPIHSNKHEFHTSIAEIEYNNQSKAFEVSLRVFIDDFEKALGSLSGKKETLDKSDKHHQLIMKYIRQRFFITNRRGKKKEMTLIGKEFKTDAVWLYIEIPFRESLRKATFTNSILMEHFDDQVNIINLQYKGKKESFLFRKNKLVQGVNIGR